MKSPAPVSRNEHPVRDEQSERGPGGHEEAGDHPCPRRRQAVQGSGGVLARLAPHSCDLPLTEDPHGGCSYIRCGRDILRLQGLVRDYTVDFMVCLQYLASAPSFLQNLDLQESFLVLLRSNAARRTPEHLQLLIWCLPM